MSGVVRYERKDRVGVITVDDPPVNGLSQAVRSGLDERLKVAVEDADAAAIVLICAGRTFCAGADISEAGKPLQPPQEI